MRRSLEIAIIAIFSALSAVSTTYTAVPSPTGGYTHIGDSMIFIAALLFGVRVGGLVGIIGPTVADLVVGYPRWYVSIVAHGLEGLIAGLGRKKGIPWQTALCLIGGIGMSLTYFSINIFIKGIGPALISLFRDIGGQTVVSTIIAIPITKAMEAVLKEYLE